MRRTKQAVSNFEPEVYRLMQEVEPNISWYLYELACADLLKRGKLTMKQWMATQRKDEPEAEPEDTVSAAM